jgi:hypothetical protein
MNNQASDDAPQRATQSKPLYQLAHLLAMLERQAEAEKARQTHHQEGKQ